MSVELQGFIPEIPEEHKEHHGNGLHEVTSFELVDSLPIGSVPEDVKAALRQLPPDVVERYVNEFRPHYGNNNGNGSITSRF